MSVTTVASTLTESHPSQRWGIERAASGEIVIHFPDFVYPQGFKLSGYQWKLTIGTVAVSLGILIVAGFCFKCSWAAAAMPVYQGEAPHDAKPSSQKKLEDLPMTQENKRDFADMIEQVNGWWPRASNIKLIGKKLETVHVLRILECGLTEHTSAYVSIWNRRTTFGHMKEQLITSLKKAHERTEFIPFLQSFAIAVYEAEGLDYSNHANDAHNFRYVLEGHVSKEKWSEFLNVLFTPR